MELNLFYCWQSDTDENKNRIYIRECILEALKNINTSNRSEFTINLQESAEGESGSPVITQEIIDRIKNCDIFIVDFSIINPYLWYEKIINFFSKTKRQLSQNTNVMMELGIAVNSIGDSQIIEVANQDYGDPYADINLVPFDRRPNEFPTMYVYNQNREKFIKTLQKRILLCANSAIKNQTKKFFPFLSFQEWEKKLDKEILFSTNQYLNQKIYQVLKANN